MSVKQWQQWMDTEDQSHLAKYDFYQPEHTFHCILVPRLVLRSSTIEEMIVELLQQGLIVLQVTCSGMEAQVRDILKDNAADRLPEACSRPPWLISREDFSVWFPYIRREGPAIA